jgi:predicted aspartyl protease
MIISMSSRKAPCEEFRKQIIRIKGRILEVDQWNTQIREVKAEALNQMDAIPILMPNISINYFHHLILTNVTDLTMHAVMTNMVKVSQITYEIHNRDMIMHTTMSEEWEEVREEISETIFGSWLSIGRAILAIMVVIVFVDFAVRFGLMLRDEYKGRGKSNRLHFWGKKDTEVEKGGEKKEIEIDTAKQEVKFTPIKLLESTVSVERNFQVNMITRKSNDDVGIHLPKLSLEANDVELTALLDTGSDLTVAPRSKVVEWCPRGIMEATGQIYGLGDQPIEITGVAYIKFKEDESSYWPARVFIIEDHPRVFSHVDIIFGTDTLEKKNIITFDFRNMTVFPSENQLKRSYKRFIRQQQANKAENPIEPSRAHNAALAQKCNYLTITMGTIEGKDVKCLVDTCSTMSVAARSFAKELGCTILPDVGRFVTASGSAMDIIGTARVNIWIYGVNKNMILNLVPDKQIKYLTKADIIIGYDFLIRMPPITFNLVLEEVSAAEESVPWAEDESELSGGGPEHGTTSRMLRDFSAEAERESTERVGRNLNEDAGRMNDPSSDENGEPGSPLFISCMHTFNPKGSSGAAVVIAKVNSVPISCLADTGASLSVAPRTLAEELGIKLTATYAEAVSASGHLIRFNEKAEVRLELAGSEVWVTLYFIEDSEFTSARDYKIIIGCNAFRLLPGAVSFDFSGGKFLVGEEWIPMGQNSIRLLEDLKVRLGESVTLPPNTQCRVEGIVQSLVPINNDLMADRAGESLHKAGLALVASVSLKSEKKISLAIINPTAEPKVLRKGMHLAWANEVMPNEFGLLYEGNNAEFMSLEGNGSVMVDPSYKVDFSKSAVEGSDLAALKRLIEEYSDVFSKSQYDLGLFTAAEHHFTTTTEEPVASAPRRMPYKYREELKRHIEQLEKSKVMVESDTPWVTPFVIVQKKDGGIRPCLDFRKLNEVTIPDRYPLPRLDSIMEKVGNCKYYTSLDLASGYLQIKLSEETSRKCGVITEDRVYQMKTMPFGLRNATATFSRVMAIVLCGLGDKALSYVDDVLIFTKEGSFQDHLAAVKQVLERFRIYNLKLSPKKCTFASKEMNFLGFVLTANGYKPSLSRIEIIKDMPVPKTVKEVKRVLGKAGFYRRHIQNFASTVEPLLHLTRHATKFEWGNEQQLAFERVKELLSEAPNLIFPDYSKPFHIFTDASTVGQGGVLMQKTEAGTFSAIAYCSRTLSMAERKWPAVQVELSAIIYSLREFRPYVFMSDVELHTDHKPLAYLLKKAETHPQLGRWLIELQNYQIKIVHIAGKQNSLADALSRADESGVTKEVENLKELEDIVEFPICLSINPCSRFVDYHFVNKLTLRHEDGNSYEVDLRTEQAQDPEAQVYIKFLQNGDFPADFNEKEKETVASQASLMMLESGILYHKTPNMRQRFYVPVSLRALIFDSFHTSPLGGGHLNYRKTLQKCRKYYWPKMHSDIVSWVQLCITCQLRHSPNPAYRAEMLMVPSNTLFARVGLDLAGPFPLTQRGNKHIMNIVCWFTKYVISIPLPDARSTTIARALLNNCYLRYGGCTELVTDNAKYFTADFFKEFCSLLYINKKYACPHWSQGNAATERTFRTFHNILAKYISKDEPDFDEYLDAACFCYNTSVHESTGESPFFLMFGRDPIFCVDQIIDPRVRDPVALTDVGEFKQTMVRCMRRAWCIAAEEHTEAQKKFKAQYDKKVRNPTVIEGDRVLLRNYDGKVNTSKKFHLPWKGLFRVIGIDGVYVDLVSCTAPQSNPKRVHINQVKKCLEVLGPTCTVPELTDEEKEMLEKAEAQEVMNEPGYNHNPSQIKGVRDTTVGIVEGEANEATQEVTKPYNLRPRRRRVSFDENTEYIYG